MKLISMEDFVLKQVSLTEEDPAPDLIAQGYSNLTLLYDFKKRVKAYALFLCTPMRFEHFHGRAAVVKIKDVSVLRPSNGKTGSEPDSIGLIFTPDEDNDYWEKTFIIKPGSPFSILANQPGVELTEEGVKLIFG